VWINLLINKIKERLRLRSIIEGKTVKLRLLDLSEKLIDDVKLLDIGCSDGKFTIEFSKKVGAKKVYGLEIDKYLIREARSKGIICKKSDANKKLPFRDNFFDVIICNQVVEHLYDPDNLFQEINRILKMNGYLYISTPNLCSLHGRIFVLLGWQPTAISPSTRFIFGNPLRGETSGFCKYNRHLTCFTPASFKEMTEFYGFKIIKYSGSVIYPFGSKISDSISRFFPSLSVYQIIKARKIRHIQPKKINLELLKKNINYEKKFPLIKN